MRAVTPAWLTWSLTPHPPAEGITARGGLAPSPGPRSGPGQDLHLSRTMLGGQGSPYVGRFACDWHRLPGRIPGQPQTQTGVRGSVAPGRKEPGEGPSGREQAHRARAGAAKDPRAFGRGGPGGQDVVDEQDLSRGRIATRETEGSVHGAAALRARSPGLGRRVPDPLQRSRRREAEDGRDGQGQGPGLVVPSGRTAPRRERNPRHALRRGWRNGGHGRPQGLGHASPAGELEPMQRGARGPLVQERSPGPRDRGRRTLEAGRERLLGGPAAASAERRQEHHEGLAARPAERPGPRPASGTALGIEEVQDGVEHSPTVEPAADRPPPRTFREVRPSGRRAPCLPERGAGTRCEPTARHAGGGTPWRCRPRSPRRGRSRERPLATARPRA